MSDAPFDGAVDVAEEYGQWVDKGPLVGGRRLTVLADRRPYRVGEPVRVHHVVEVTEPGRDVYVMGPKPVHGEYVDGQLATPPVPEGPDPLVPANYDGRTLASPAVDHNYEVTTYSFRRAGTHSIQWKMGELSSNVLRIEVS